MSIYIYDDLEFFKVKPVKEVSASVKLLLIIITLQNNSLDKHIKSYIQIIFYKTVDAVNCYYPTQQLACAYEE